MKKLIIWVVIIAILIGIDVAIFDFNDHTYTATVTDKERIIKGDDSYYLIFAEKEDGSVVVLKNEDSLFRGKFNSSNLYGALEEGGTYDFTVVGYRIPLFSTYENIISVD